MPELKHSFEITLAPVTVIDKAPVAISPPLRGRGYLAGDGCCDTIRHVRALLPLDGRFALAQRFAIDWEQADDEGRLLKGDPKKVSSYNIFGQNVHAVADGKVVAVKPENGGTRISIFLNVFDVHVNRTPISFGTRVLYGQPAITSTASAPPTPIATMPSPPALGVCESVPIIMPPGKA